MTDDRFKDGSRTKTVRGESQAAPPLIEETIERVCELVERIDAFSQAASRSLEHLPCTNDQRHRRGIAHLFYLVEATARATTEAAEYLRHATDNRF